MTHPIIKTDNYILITSDEEIKIGDYWHYLGEKDNPVKNVLGKSWFEKLHDVKMYKKVIAHLPLNNEPILEGVTLLPPLPNEDDEIIENLENYLLKVNQLYKDWLGIGFKGGYHKAKEKYNITSDKILDLYIEETGYGMDMWSKEENATMLVIAKIIDSLSQPKLPVGFKCEMELNPVNHASGLKLTGNLIMDIAITQNYTPKIINGVMQGEWIFE